MEHFSEKLGVSLLFALIAAFFAWSHMSPMETGYVAAATFFIFLFPLVCGKPIYTAYVEHRKLQAEQQAQHHTLAMERRKIALQEQQARTEQEHKTRELALASSEAEVRRMIALLEAQIKQGQAQREYTQPLVVTSQQWLYRPDSGMVIAPPESLIRQPAQQQTIVTQLPHTQEALPEAPRFRDIVALVSQSSLPLCWASDGAKMGTFRDLLSMGLIGRPERGKTTALLYYVCILLLIKAEIWIWDLHGSMSALRGLNYFDSFDSIIDSIPALNAELEERDELYHEVPKRIKHPIVLLVDELPALAGRYNALDRQIRKATPSPLLTAQTFTLEARKWNGFTFLAGQSLPYSVLPTLARDNLSSRIIFECSADHAQQMQLQKMAIDTMLPRLRGAPRGTHIADFSTWSAPLLADIPFTDESDLEWVLARCNRSPFTEERTFERRTGPLGGMSVNTVNEPVKGGEWVGERGEYSPQTVNSPTQKVNVSPEEKAQILAGAHAQLQVSGDEKVKRSQLRDDLGWNNKMFPKIKQVLDQEGL